MSGRGEALIELQIKIDERKELSVKKRGEFIEQWCVASTGIRCGERCPLFICLDGMSLKELYLCQNRKYYVRIMK